MNISAYNQIKDPKHDNDTIEIVKKFSKRKLNGTGFLGYRDLPENIASYVEGNKALDYGCGCGYSTSILDNLGFNAVGCDISEIMLQTARKCHPKIRFINNILGKLPFAKQEFDLVLSTFVLLDIPNEKEMLNYLTSAQKVMKPSGTLIATTVSEIFHLYNWKTIRNNILENKKLLPGEIFSTELTDTKIKFYDYFYTDSIYRNLLHKAGFQVITVKQHFGLPSDGIKWSTETSLAPYVTYICKPFRQ